MQTGMYLQQPSHTLDERLVSLVCFEHEAILAQRGGGAGLTVFIRRLQRMRRLMHGVSCSGCYGTACHYQEEESPEGGTKSAAKVQERVWQDAEATATCQESHTPDSTGSRTSNSGRALPTQILSEVQGMCLHSPSSCSWLANCICTITRQDHNYQPHIFSIACLCDWSVIESSRHAPPLAPGLKIHSCIFTWIWQEQGNLESEIWMFLTPAPASEIADFVRPKAQQG